MDLEKLQKLKDELGSNKQEDTGMSDSEKREQMESLLRKYEEAKIAQGEKQDVADWATAGSSVASTLDKYSANPVGLQARKFDAGQGPDINDIQKEAKLKGLDIEKKDPLLDLKKRKLMGDIVTSEEDKPEKVDPLLEEKRQKMLAEIEKLKRVGGEDPLLDLKKQKLQAQIGKLNRKGKSSEEGLSEGQKAVDKDYAKEYNKFTASGKNNAANTIEKLEKLQKEVAADTGFGEAGGTRFPIPDMLRSRLAIERRDDARNFANKTLKELFGGQLSDAEREAAAREFWNDNLDNESNAERLKGKIKELKDNLIAQTAKAAYYEKEGTLQNFNSLKNSDSVQESSDSPEVVKRKTKDGRVALFDSKTKKFLKYED